jgi:hypothetical protein
MGVHNAGVMAVPMRQRTADGFELQFGPTSLGRPGNRLDKIRALVMSHDLDVGSGSYVAPSRPFQLKGDPVLVKVPKPARDQRAARTLWEVSRKLTGVAFAGLS